MAEKKAQWVKSNVTKLDEWTTVNTAFGSDCLSSADFIH